MIPPIYHIPHWDEKKSNSETRIKRYTLVFDYYWHKNLTIFSPLWKTLNLPNSYNYISRLLKPLIFFSVNKCWGIKSLYSPPKWSSVLTGAPRKNLLASSGHDSTKRVFLSTIFIMLYLAFRHIHDIDLWHFKFFGACAKSKKNNFYYRQSGHVIRLAITPWTNFEKSIASTFWKLFLQFAWNLLQPNSL